MSKVCRHRCDRNRSLPESSLPHRRGHRETQSAHHQEVSAKAKAGVESPRGCAARTFGRILSVGSIVGSKPELARPALHGSCTPLDFVSRSGVEVEEGGLSVVGGLVLLEVAVLV